MKFNNRSPHCPDLAGKMEDMAFSKTSELQHSDCFAGFSVTNVQCYISSYQWGSYSLLQGKSFRILYPKKDQFKTDSKVKKLNRKDNEYTAGDVSESLERIKLRLR